MASSVAYAQFDVQDCNGDVTTCSVILSSTSSSTTALGGGLIFTALLGSDQATTMRKFLNDNRVALLADISIGSGEVLEDFALLAGVSEKDIFRFGRRLRTKRHAFSRTMRVAIKDKSGAEQFIVWLEALKNS